MRKTLVLEKKTNNVSNKKHYILVLRQIIHEITNQWQWFQQQQHPKKNSHK